MSPKRSPSGCGGARRHSGVCRHALEAWEAGAGSSEAVTLAEFYVVRTHAEPAATEISMLVLYAYTAVYLVLDAGLFVGCRGSVRILVARTVANARAALGPEDGSGTVEHAD
jgi:hypothetical protein